MLDPRLQLADVLVDLVVRELEMQTAGNQPAVCEGNKGRSDDEHFEARAAGAQA